MRIFVAHPPQLYSRTPIQPRAFCGRRRVDIVGTIAGRPPRCRWEHPLPTDATVLVGMAAVGIAHHLQRARNLSKGRAVVLSGDEWDRGCVFKRTARDRPVRWYLTSQLVEYKGKKWRWPYFDALQAPSRTWTYWCGYARFSSQVANAYTYHSRIL
jgi:hypothetical protein